MNSRWGDTTAILVGDLIYARACELMTATGDLRIIAAFTQAIKRMSEGELIQLDNLYNLDLSEEKWLQIVPLQDRRTAGRNLQGGRTAG